MTVLPISHFAAGSFLICLFAMSLLSGDETDARPVQIPDELNIRRDVGLGDVCLRDSDCRTNECELFKCVCTKDEHCPGNQHCHTPSYKRNYCH